MGNNRKLLAVMLIVILVILAACGNSVEESIAEQDNQLPDNGSTQNANGDSTNTDLEDVDKNKIENFQEDTDDIEINDHEDTSGNTSTNSNDGGSLKSSNSDNEMIENKKEEYLKELNDMEESDKYSDVGTTTLELEEQEAERYKKWDVKLNEIYGMLKEQLHPEQMDKLRDEQRNWIKQRDETAKASSLKYKGGSAESLEYVATQASLTRERCYELVAKYMK